MRTCARGLDAGLFWSFEKSLFLTENDGRFTAALEELNAQKEQHAAVLIEEVKP